MATEVDWSLETTSLKKQLLLLSKSKLIKICKSKKVSYNGNKNDMINRLLLPTVSDANKPKKKKKKNIVTKKQTKKYYDRNELLVAGFVRSIQTLLSNDQSIPNELFKLCYLFHFTDINIFCKLIISIGQFIYWTEFGSIDIEKQSQSKIALKSLKNRKKNRFVNSLCFIENISHILPDYLTNYTKEKDLNGIFGCCQIGDYHDKSNALIPSLILYEQNDNHKSMKAKYEFKSETKLKHNSLSLPKQFLFICNDKILYEYNGLFYQLKLKNIQTPNDLSNFKILRQNQQKFTFNCSYQRIQFLDMTYLSNKQSIFCVECYNNDLMKISCPKPRFQSHSVLCGLFNINNNDWIDIKSYEYTKSIRKSQFKSATCYDYNKSIFMVTTDADTVRYDFKKNKWELLCDKGARAAYHDGGILWKDINDILYNLTPDDGLQQFDLRDQKAWSSCDLISNMKGMTKKVIDRAYFC
eukprot:171379_1